MQQKYFYAPNLGFSRQHTGLVRDVTDTDLAKHKMAALKAVFLRLSNVEL